MPTLADYLALSARDRARDAATRLAARLLSLATRCDDTAHRVAADDLGRATLLTRAADRLRHRAAAVLASA